MTRQIPHFETDVLSPAEFLEMSLQYKQFAGRMAYQSNGLKRAFEQGWIRAHNYAEKES